MEFIFSHALLIVGGLFLLWLLIKLFTLSGQVSRLQNKIESMSQEVALNEKRREDSSSK